MAPRQPLNDEQRRLLRITGRMPLASVANLASTLGATEDRVRAMLGRRFFLTSQAVDLLYVNDHQHPSPREEAQASGFAAFHPEGELSPDFQERFALDHDHQPHLEGPGNSPFAAGDEAAGDGETHDHEHPPWTATSRGVEMSLRRLSMLEPVYRLAPDLISSGRLSWPSSTDDTAASREVRMTDFRLLRRGGFYHAVARHGEQVWTPLTYAGVHATERALRRKEQHRFWGGGGLLLQRGGPLPAHRQPHLLRGPGRTGLALGPGGGGSGRLGPGTGPEHPHRQHPHPVLHSRWAVHPGGGAASLKGPGVGPLGASRRGQAGGGGRLAQAKPRRGGHRRQAGPPGVPGHLPVPRHAGLLAQGDSGRVFKRGIPPPGAVRGDRPGGGVRRAALPVGTGDEAGGQHEPGAALGYPQPPRGLPGPLVPGARGAPPPRG